MRTTNKKTVLVITLTICGLTLAITYWLGWLAHEAEIIEKLWGTALFRKTGWFLGCCFAVPALVGTLYWKPDGRLLRGIVIFFSVIVLISMLVWFFEMLAFRGGNIPGL